MKIDKKISFNVKVKYDEEEYNLQKKNDEENANCSVGNKKIC